MTQRRAIGGRTRVGGPAGARSLGGLAEVAARNIPGVLEVALLGRLAMPAGNRYAVSQVARYAIVVGGILAISMVRALPLVLKEPEPTVFFVGLGENALNFEVRVGPYSPLRTRHSESVK